MRVGDEEGTRGRSGARMDVCVGVEVGARTEWTRARAHVCDGGGRRVCVCMHASVNVGTDACACGTARLYSRGRACPIPCAIIIHKPRQGCKGGT